MNISLAIVTDIKQIMSFINSEWKEGHILARDELFFRYEHQNCNNINFVIAKDDEYKIVGVLGFIAFAPNQYSDVATVIWKVVKNNQNPTLGIELLQYLQRLYGTKMVCSVGINKKTIGIYKYLGMYTDTLNHYALINFEIEKFIIAKVNGLREPINLIKPFVESYIVKLVKDNNELLKFNYSNNNIPNKNSAYLNKRYFEHPFYKYEVFSIHEADEIAGIFVTRVEVFEGAKALRIVDFLGDEQTIRPFAIFLSQLMREEKYEYADFYCFGLNEKILLNSGFHLVDPNDEQLIIPNYFNPFIQKNIPIYFFADTLDVNMLRLFKADGDQDRPS